MIGYVVYLLIPTSNHNMESAGQKPVAVVYLLIPTSNHNFDFYHNAYIKLYIF